MDYIRDSSTDGEGGFGYGEWIISGTPQLKEKEGLDMGSGLDQGFLN